MDDELAAMANDPEIQKELRLIEAEFADAEDDGLSTSKMLCDIALAYSSKSGSLDPKIETAL